tara:strand:+ start:61 stop:234 length:174 start_codon:yes stop_codon:yes gene_type:complete
LARKRKILLKQLFELIINSLNDIKIELWDTPRNIEEDEKSAQRKDGLEKETRRDSSV